MASQTDRLDLSTRTQAIAPVLVEQVIVNTNACRRLAALLSSWTIPIDREDSSLPWMSPDQISNFYLLLVAICHQTSPRGRAPLEGDVNGRHLRGWDYLSAKLEMAAHKDLEMLLPGYWAEITVDHVREIFQDDILGDRLSDPMGRTLLVQDLGQKMRSRSWNSAQQLHDACKGHIATGNTNLLRLLAQFQAYSDPVHKKSFFFLALMHNTGLWTYADPEQLGAPIDYHEVRGHLRIGTVELSDPNLRAKLMEGREVTPEEDIAIRQAVHKAIMLLSEYSGIRNPSRLHYLFWNVFRSCCGRESTHCDSCQPACSLPTRYVPLALFPGGARHCPFSEVCTSAGRDSKLLEQVIDTDYY